LPSIKDKDVDLILGMVDGFELMVALNRKTKTLITVRKMSRKERKLYGRTFENE